MRPRPPPACVPCGLHRRTVSHGEWELCPLKYCRCAKCRKYKQNRYAPKMSGSTAEATPPGQNGPAPSTGTVAGEAPAEAPTQLPDATAASLPGSAPPPLQKPLPSAEGIEPRQAQSSSIRVSLPMWLKREPPEDAAVARRPPSDAARPASRSADVEEVSTPECPRVAAPIRVSLPLWIKREPASDDGRAPGEGMPRRRPRKKAALPSPPAEAGAAPEPVSWVRRSTRTRAPVRHVYVPQIERKSRSPAVSKDRGGRILPTGARGGAVKRDFLNFDFSELFDLNALEEMEFSLPDIKKEPAEAEESAEDYSYLPVKKEEAFDFEYDAFSFGENSDSSGSFRRPRKKSRGRGRGRGRGRSQGRGRGKGRGRSSVSADGVPRASSYQETFPLEAASEKPKRRRGRPKKDTYESQLKMVSQAEEKRNLSGALYNYDTSYSTKSERSPFCRELSASSTPYRFLLPQSGLSPVADYDPLRPSADPMARPVYGRLQPVRDLHEHGSFGHLQSIGEAMSQRSSDHTSFGHLQAVDETMPPRSSDHTHFDLQSIGEAMSERSSGHTSFAPLGEAVPQYSSGRVQPIGEAMPQRSTDHTSFGLLQPIVDPMDQNIYGHAHLQPISQRASYGHVDHLQPMAQRASYGHVDHLQPMAQRSSYGHVDHLQSMAQRASYGHVDHLQPMAQRVTYGHGNHFRPMVDSVSHANVGYSRHQQPVDFGAALDFGDYHVMRNRRPSSGPYVVYCKPENQRYHAAGYPRYSACGIAHPEARPFGAGAVERRDMVRTRGSLGFTDSQLSQFEYGSLIELCKRFPTFQRKSVQAVFECCKRNFRTTELVLNKIFSGNKVLLTHNSGPDDHSCRIALRVTGKYSHPKVPRVEKKAKDADRTGEIEPVEPAAEKASGFRAVFRAICDALAVLNSEDALLP